MIKTVIEYNLGLNLNPYFFLVLLFNLNWVVNLSNQNCRKSKLLSENKLEMKNWPNSRFIKKIEHLARMCGSQVSLEEPKGIIFLCLSEHEL